MARLVRRGRKADVVLSELPHTYSGVDVWQLLRLLEDHTLVEVLAPTDERLVVLVCLKPETIERLMAKREPRCKGTAQKSAGD